MRADKEPGTIGLGVVADLPGLLGMALGIVTPGGDLALARHRDLVGIGQQAG